MNGDRPQSCHETVTDFCVFPIDLWTTGDGDKAWQGRVHHWVWHEREYLCCLQCTWAWGRWAVDDPCSPVPHEGVRQPLGLCGWERRKVMPKHHEGAADLVTHLWPREVAGVVASSEGSALTSIADVPWRGYSGKLRKLIQLLRRKQLRVQQPDGSPGNTADQEGPIPKGYILSGSICYYSLEISKTLEMEHRVVVARS